MPDLGAECLNENWFLSLDDARAKIEEWRRCNNGERPHGALGNLAPGGLRSEHPRRRSD